MVPEGVLLVGIDVESLYTSIPHIWGPKATQHFLDNKFPLQATQNEFIIDLLQFMLDNNCFQFLGVYYRQIRGTSMGAPWAPSYACLHLGLWKLECVYPSLMYLGHCLLWLRYIDDVIMLWNGASEDLVTFMEELNSNDRNIRLTYTYNSETLSFLDLFINIEGGKLQTRTF